MKCEDCGDVAAHRRIRCKHCGLLLCRWCFGHTHGIVLPAVDTRALHEGKKQ
jgi:hypothetical protein